MSKYARSVVSDVRDDMNHFVTGLLDALKEECHSAMQHDNMKISRLMVHAKKEEKTRVKRKSIDANRARSFDGCSSKGRLDI